MEKIFCLHWKKMVERFWIEVSGLTSSVQNYQDERCTGTTGCKNKYIWQNTFNRLRLVVEVS